MPIPTSARTNEDRTRRKTWTRGLLIALVTGLSLPAASALMGSSTAAAAPSKKAKAKKAKRKRAAKRRRRAKRKRQALEAAVISPPCEIKTSDIIQTKIDIGAQVSMMRKMSGDDTSRYEASSIIKALENGTLAAVLLPPRKAVSDRGQRMSPPQGYWTMIPKGKNSVCLQEPAGEAPMIVYREKLQPAQIDAAISEAWKDCDVPGVPRACEYTVDLHKPNWDCTTNKQCQDRHGSDLYYCNPDTHTCGLDMPENKIEQDCRMPPNCVVGDPQSNYESCGAWVTNLCVPQAGSACGVCKGKSDASSTCHDKNNGKHTKERAKCKAAHSPGKTAKYAAKCTASILKCTTDPLKNHKACAEAIECGVDPKPVAEYQQCLKTETIRWQGERDRCNTL